MTQNQIAYFKAKEEQTHNREMERENAKHNRATEVEAVRHAMRQEEIDTEKNRITHEFNTGTLEHYVRTDSEANRTNRENERIKSFQNLENVRHDVATEQIERDKNYVNRLNVGVRERELSETERHAKATEQLTREKQTAEIENIRQNTKSQYSNTLLDSMRFDQIKADTLLTYEKNKTEGFNRLLTEAKIYSESALTDLRKAQTEETAMSATYAGWNAWSNAMRGLGGLLSGLKGLPVIPTNPTGQYDSSTNYNYYTGLYE